MPTSSQQESRSRWWEPLTRSRGGPLTDFYLRVAGSLGFVGIVVSVAVPGLADLVAYVALAIWFNGPQSPVVPAGFEPVLLLYGQLYPAVLIAALGTVGNVVIEVLNYRLFAMAADAKSVRKVHQTRVVRWLTRVFRRAPFIAVAVCAAAFPFWIARVLVVLSHYPLKRHLLATAVGRFPRSWLFAALGASIAIPPGWLAIVVAISLIVTVVALVVKRSRSKSGSGDPAPPESELVPATE